MKKLCLILGILLIISIFLIGCKQVPTEVQEELDVEAEILAQEESIDNAEAQDLVGEAYKRANSWINFLDCSDSDNGKNFEEFGKVIIGYNYGAREKTITLLDRCSRNNILEYYCRNGRPARTMNRCPKGCKKGACISLCAKEGKQYSKVYTDEYPKNCCKGLTEWESGTDTRKVEDGKCVKTGLESGWPVGTCINCGNDICEDIENVCNCPQDCKNICCESKAVMPNATPSYSWKEKSECDSSNIEGISLQIVDGSFCEPKVACTIASCADESTPTPTGEYNSYGCEIYTCPE